MTALTPALALDAAVATGPAGAAEVIVDTQDFAPFAVDGVVAGPAAELIREVGAASRLACTLRLRPWRRAQQEVQDGQEIVARYRMDPAPLD